MTSLEAQGTAAGGGVRFLGDARAYWRLLIRGAALLMVTLGIYRFWLATDVRRFLWANTEIAGETLEYTGTPLELLLGFLVAIAILIPVYIAFFLAALGDLASYGAISGLVGFALLGLLGQYAVYRARRYRLTRTIYRGLRFHQEGSPWRYALRAVLWWVLTALTFGLAYPFQLASLERYKMRNTFYGDLRGRFDGSGFGLFLRGLPMWFLVLGPITIAVGAFLETVDWKALGDALEKGGNDVMSHIASGNPALGKVAVFGMLMATASGVMAALLYPAFQAMVLRWWSSGLAFGEIAMKSRLRTVSVYGAYMRFLGWSLLFLLGVSFAGGVIAGSIFGTFGRYFTAPNHSPILDIIAALGGLGLYVVTMLGLSTVYRVTVMLSLWKLGMESLQLSGLSALDRVKATGKPSSALGEGLADALNVGGY